MEESQGRKCGTFGIMQIPSVHTAQKNQIFDEKMKRLYLRLYHVQSAACYSQRRRSPKNTQPEKKKLTKTDLMKISNKKKSF